jgi:acrylyl-CoA reductase (NADPH)
LKSRVIEKRTDKMTDQSTFKALVLREDGGKVAAAIETLADADLPDGDVTVGVRYSTLNYKDGMVLGGIGRLVRTYPHVPGIDFAGVVETSASPDFAPGDRVVLTGWRVGEAHWGGYAERARVKSDWLVKLPDGLSEYQAMALGTAGFTAMLAVIALEGAGLGPDRGEVLVTGANGGVGGVALALLAGLGYTVAASTGRPEASDHLTALGAATIIDRAELAAAPERPLLAERWAGAVDAVGGTTLASILAQTAYDGAVAACGLAGGTKLETTVIPFLLRGVKLLGIESVMCPRDRREAAWARLAREMPADALERLSHTVPLAALAELGPKILQGRTQGRVVVDVTA